jgi:hypothetical protein
MITTKEQDYCSCENDSGVYSRSNEWGEWDCCTDCDKVIEDSYRSDDEPMIEDL